jgi:chromosomal replication initiation ATPase DnaA
VLDHAGDVVQVAAPNQFERQWFETQLRRRVDEALGARGFAGVRVLFVTGAA